MGMSHSDGVRLDHVVTSGTFSLDGETHEVDNNVWVIGDEEECVVIDAPHDTEKILDVVGGRKLAAILLHPRPRRPRAGRAGAPRGDRRADPAAPRREAAVGADPPRAAVGRRPERRPGPARRRHQAHVLHTPGHAPGAVCFFAPDLGAVFTGDTLFQGGPGATGRSFSDADVIKESIRTRLFPLPDDTVVHTGHGDDTTIGAEAAALGR